jgi:two-component system OmpR family response regulator
MRLLLVEDEAGLARQVVLKIESAGYEVDVAATIEEANSALATCAYSLTLLDRRLPDGDGLELIQRIRTNIPGARILMLTAFDAIDEKIEGLEAGADDYLTKPFNLDELIARIRANLRKNADGRTPIVQIGTLCFDLDRRELSIGNRQVFLSRRELVLLETLLRRARCVVSRETLISELYGFDVEVQEHALTSLVSRLRARLGELDAGVEIYSARALGYMLRESGQKGRIK